MRMAIWYNCGQCGRTFDLNSKLTRHIEETHSNVGLGWLCPAPTCKGQAFRRRPLFTRHLRLVHGTLALGQKVDVEYLQFHGSKPTLGKPMPTPPDVQKRLQQARNREKKARLRELKQWQPEIAAEETAQSTGMAGGEDQCFVRLSSGRRAPPPPPKRQLSRYKKEEKAKARRGQQTKPEASSSNEAPSPPRRRCRKRELLPYKVETNGSVHHGEEWTDPHWLPEVVYISSDWKPPLSPRVVLKKLCSKPASSENESSSLPQRRSRKRQLSPYKVETNGSVGHREEQKDPYLLSQIVCMSPDWEAPLNPRVIPEDQDSKHPQLDTEDNQKTQVKIEHEQHDEKLKVQGEQQMNPQLEALSKKKGDEPATLQFEGVAITGGEAEIISTCPKTIKKSLAGCTEASSADEAQPPSQRHNQKRQLSPYEVETNCSVGHGEEQKDPYLLPQIVCMSPDWEAPLNPRVTPEDQDSKHPQLDTEDSQETQVKIEHEQRDEKLKVQGEQQMKPQVEALSKEKGDEPATLQFEGVAITGGEAEIISTCPKTIKNSLAGCTEASSANEAQPPSQRHNRKRQLSPYEVETNRFVGHGEEQTDPRLFLEVVSISSDEEAPLSPRVVQEELGTKLASSENEFSSPPQRLSPKRELLPYKVETNGSVHHGEEWTDPHWLPEVVYISSDWKPPLSPRVLLEELRCKPACSENESSSPPQILSPKRQLSPYKVETNGSVGHREKQKDPYLLPQIVCMSSDWEAPLNPRVIPEDQDSKHPQLDTEDNQETQINIENEQHDEKLKVQGEQQMKPQVEVLSKKKGDEPATLQFEGVAITGSEAEIISTCPKTIKELSAGCTEASSADKVQPPSQRHNRKRQLLPYKLETNSSVGHGKEQTDPRLLLEVVSISSDEEAPLSPRVVLEERGTKSQQLDKEDNQEAQVNIENEQHDEKVKVQGEQQMKPRVVVSSKKQGNEPATLQFEGVAITGSEAVVISTPSKTIKESSAGCTNASSSNAQNEPQPVASTSQDGMTVLTSPKVSSEVLPTSEQLCLHTESLRQTSQGAFQPIVEAGLEPSMETVSHLLLIWAGSRLVTADLTPPPQWEITSHQGESRLHLAGEKFLIHVEQTVGFRRTGPGSTHEIQIWFLTRCPRMVGNEPRLISNLWRVSNMDQETCIVTSIEDFAYP